jgi:hypothetical protein
MDLGLKKEGAFPELRDKGAFDRGGVMVLVVIIAAILVRFWLTAGLPITAHAHGVYDDALFIRLAQSIASGEWLGEYDMLTLVKAPLYPLFIALNYLSGLQFKSMEHLLYIFACLVQYFALTKVGVNRNLALIPFLFLLFNPYHHGSVERGWFYAAVVFLVISGLQYMISLRAVSGCVKLHHAFLLGLGLAAIYLSREETIWLYPLLIVAFGLLFYQPGKLTMVQAAIKLLPMLVLGLAIPVVAVKSMNYHKYGFYGITDKSSKAYKSAVKKIESVHSGDEIPFVVVSKKSLQQMFDASPTFASLKPYILGDMGKHWGGLMCRRHSEACGEIGGGYFFWALRQALSEAGHFQNYDHLQDVYSAIANELDQACASGQLDCSRRIWPLRYPIRIDRLDDNLAKLPSFAYYMLSGFNGRLPGYGLPHGPENVLEVFKRLSHASLVPKPQQELYVVSGWLLSDSPEKYVAIIPKPFAAYSNRFSLEESKDVQRHFENSRYSGLSRFTVEGPCKNRQCELLVMSGAKQANLDQSLIRPGADLMPEGMHLHIDTVKQKQNQQQLPGVVQWKIDTFKKIGAIYNHTLLYLSLIALVVCLFACYQFLFKGYRSLLLGGVLIVVMGIGARLGVLVLFDDFTQSPIVGQMRHFIPAIPLLLLFVGLNFLISIDLFNRMRRVGNKHPELR